MPKPYPEEFREDVVRVARNRPDGVTLEQIAAAAPATIPATSAATFAPGWAPLSVGTVSCSSTSTRSRARSANATTRTSPPADTRFGSSNRADARADVAIGEDAWTTIRYPHAVFDEQLRASGSATLKSARERSLRSLLAARSMPSPLG